MPSKTETVLQALFAAMAAPHVLPAGATLERNASLPARIPSAGAVILRDGDPGQPEVTLSPLMYHFEHRAEIDILIDRPQVQADAAFDTLRVAIGTALVADRTLGGLCDWVEPEAPVTTQIALEGAETFKAATIFVTLHYSAADPLG